MLKLKRILAEHQKNTPKNCLKNNLGDGFLLAHNPVFRAVREAAIRSGYRFSADRFFDYDVLALTQLPKILKHKTIPYRNNVTALKEVERRAPGAFQFDELPKLQPNHLFHEAAHGVARTLTRKNLGTPRGDRNRALTLLLEESFANACESLANAFSESPLHDEFLYKNSYIMEKEPTRKALRAAMEAFGVQPAFQLLVFSFLYSNFIQTTTAKKDLDRLQVLIFKRSLNRSELQLVQAVFKTGFDLDQRFTIFTNAFCLRLEGIRKELFELLAFDFLAVFEKDERYRKCLKEMSSLLSYGL